MRNYLLMGIITFIFLTGVGVVSAAAAPFSFNGSVLDQNGNSLNNSIGNVTVTITVKSMTDFSTIGYNRTIANASGWFSLLIGNESTIAGTEAPWLFELSIVYFNGTAGGGNSTNINNVFASHVSKPIPPMPGPMMRLLAGSNFYLVKAGTINITVKNLTGTALGFNYQVKDQGLNYPIASSFGQANTVTGALVYVPIDKNYSIMVFPNNTLPLSFNWNNFSATMYHEINVSGLVNARNNYTTYNFTQKTLFKVFNTTMTLTRITGYVNYTNGTSSFGVSNWSNFTIIPYMLEAGNIVHSTFGVLPINMSFAFGDNNNSDVFVANTGFYNITLPATLEGSKYLLFATGFANFSTNSVIIPRSSNLTRGGFKNISLTYGTGSYSENITAYGLFGGSYDIPLINFSNTASIVRSRFQTFNIVNRSNLTLGTIVTNSTMHAEVTVDYSGVTNSNTTRFTWIVDVAQGDSNFTLPLLNYTGVEQLNLYVGGGPTSGQGQFAPKKISYTSEDMRSGTNITNVTVGLFNPQGLDTALASNNIYMALYKSNSSCDVPNPDNACLLGSSTTMALFNPLQAVMGGGKISFRMGSISNGIYIHYANVDMIASGPPDVIFDSGTTIQSSSGSVYENVRRFGSGGPKIYDFVIASMPYSVAPSIGLDDSKTINLTVPLLYDENWNIIWNTTANTTNATGLGGNFTYYNARATEWNYLLTGTNCVVNQSILNQSSPCFVDTGADLLWVRIPHFSGTGPVAAGSLVAAASTSTTTSTSSGNSGTEIVSWLSTKYPTIQEVSAGYTENLAVKNRVRVILENKDHYVGVISLTSSTATINVSSNPQQVILNVGETKKLDVDDDNKYYDLSLTLNSIANSKASVTIKSIHEFVTVPVEPGKKAPPETIITPSPFAEPKLNIGTLITWIIILLIIIAIITLVIVYFVKKKGNKWEKKFRTR